MGVLNKTYPTKKKLQRHASFRESRYGYSGIKISFAEKLTKVNPYIQYFIFIIDDSLTFFLIHSTFPFLSYDAGQAIESP
jgi:hypothetical protein